MIFFRLTNWRLPLGLSNRGGQLGPNGMGDEIIQNLDGASLGRLALIYNVSLSLGYIPERWKGAQGVFISKIPDPSPFDQFLLFTSSSRGWRGLLGGTWRRLGLFIICPSDNMPSGRINPPPHVFLRWWNVLNLRMALGFSLISKGHSIMFKPLRYWRVSEPKGCWKVLLSGMGTVCPLAMSGSSWKLPGVDLY